MFNILDFLSVKYPNISKYLLIYFFFKHGCEGEKLMVEFNNKKNNNTNDSLKQLPENIKVNRNEKYLILDKLSIIT